jgi:carboxypeptidase Taq
MAGAIGPIEPLIAAGETRTLQAWLQSHVWPLGRTVNGEELVEQVSGDILGARPFLNHLNGKVEQLLNRT